MRGLSPSALTAVAGVTALVASFKGLTSSLKGAIDNFSHFESMQKGLETFFQSAEKGKAKFEELRKLSNETTFGVDELADSFTQLANVGVNVDTINDKLMMLGNISGGNKQKFAELVQIYSKIQSTGKAGAMQIQQLASRGVPIYDMLKKIGVQGTATGEDITKAFQEMTKEGGQFYNAMNNINDTIEGKEGFISDYFKEMTVNFTEVTGIADAYKAVLDIVREAIGTVSDKLKELNENPVMKSIITGATMATLTSLALIIGGSLVSALVAVNMKLKETVILKSILDPKTLGVTMLIGGLVGIGVAVNNLKKEEKDVNTELEKQIQLRKDLANNGGTTGATAQEKSATLQRLEEQLNIYSNSTTFQNMQSGIYKNYSELVKSTEKQLKEVALKIENASESAKKEVESYMDSNGRIVTPQLSAEQKEYRKLLVAQEQLRDSYTKLIAVKEENLKAENLEKNIETLKEEIRVQTQLEGTLEKINEIDPFKKKNEEIEKYEESIKDVEKAYKQMGIASETFDKNGVLKTTYDLQINIDPSYKDKLDEVKKELEEKLLDAKIKLSVDSQSNWQKQLQSAFGFTGKEVYEGSTSSTVGAIQSFKEIMTKQGELINSLTGKDNNEYQKEMYQGIIKAFESIMSSVRDGTYQGTEESLKSFATEVENAEKNLRQLSLQDINKTYNNDIAMNNLLNNGSRAGAKDAKSNMMSSLEKEIRGLLDKGFKPMDVEVQKLVKQYKELESQTKDFADSFNEWIENLKSSDNPAEIVAGYGMGMLTSYSKDLENFVQGFSAGGIWGGIIATLAGAIANCASTCENFDEAMNPITTWIMELKPFIQIITSLLGKIVVVIGKLFNGIGQLLGGLKPLTDFIEQIISAFRVPILIISIILKAFGQLLQKLCDAIVWVINKITFGLVDAANDLADQLQEAYDNMDETIETEKKNAKDLTSAYKSLLDAMKENEEWYLRERTALNANTRKNEATKVNDMILTPKGTFSTHPEDTIIAMKHPEQLGKTSGENQIVFNMNVVNEMGKEADVQTVRTPNAMGGEDVLVRISRKIANDVAEGANGWDTALSRQTSRMAGRSILL